jgi:hypothetical protein
MYYLIEPWPTISIASSDSYGGFQDTYLFMGNNTFYKGIIIKRSRS